MNNNRRPIFSPKVYVYLLVSYFFIKKVLKSNYFIKVEKVFSYMKDNINLQCLMILV